MNLYQISNEYQGLIQQIEDADGVLEDKDLALLDETYELIQDKCIAVAKYIENMRAEREAISNALEQMTSRAVKLSNKMSNLNKYLKENMEKCNIHEIKSPWFLLKIKKNPVGVEIIDESLLSPAYLTPIITYRPNKKLIKEQLEKGVPISGATLKQTTRLEIK